MMKVSREYILNFVERCILYRLTYWGDSAFALSQDIKAAFDRVNF